MALTSTQTAQLRDSCRGLGGSFRVNADGTVACDGLRSIVRKAWSNAVDSVVQVSGSIDRPSAITSIINAVRRNPAQAQLIRQALPGGVGRIVDQAAPIIDTLTGGGTMAGPSIAPGTNLTAGGGGGIPGFGPQECKFPMVRIGDKCLNLAALPPGGTPAVTSAPGVAVMGAFGIPALQPEIVGEINGSPVRRCPAGSVLGRDDLCYWKGSIPRNLRKWPPPARPALTAQDVKTIRRADSLRGKVERLAKSVGACKPPRRRKK